MTRYWTTWQGTGQARALSLYEMFTAPDLGLVHLVQVDTRVPSPIRGWYQVLGLLTTYCGVVIPSQWPQYFDEYRAVTCVLCQAADFVNGIEEHVLQQTDREEVRSGGPRRPLVTGGTPERSLDGVIKPWT